MLVRSHHFSPIVLMAAWALGCAEAGQPIAWPDVDARLLVVLADAGSGPMRAVVPPIVRNDEDPAGPWGPAALTVATGEELVLVFLDEPALRALHPQIDLDRLNEATVLPPDSSCEQRFEPDQGTATGLPRTAAIYVREGEGFVPAPEAETLRRRAGVLSVFLSAEPCRTGVEARGFGADWSVFPDEFEFDGKLLRRDRPADYGPFYIFAADYVGPDRIAIGTFWGLVLINRGEVLTSTAGPNVLDVRALAEPGTTGSGAIEVAAQPRAPAPGTRRLGVSLVFEKDGITAGRLSVYDVDDEGLHLVSETPTQGAAELMITDPRGRLLALIFNQSDDLDRGRILGVLGDGPAFELITLERPLARIRSTGVSSPPHVFMASDGEVFEGDVTLPASTWRSLRPPDGVFRLSRGLAAGTDEKGRYIFIDADSTRVDVYRENSGWQLLPVHPDQEVRSSECRTSPDACGLINLGPRPSRLWATHDDAGPKLVIAPSTCSVAVSTRAEAGCMGLIDIGQTPLGSDSQAPITTVTSNAEFNRGLILGGSGMVIELSNSR